MITYGATRLVILVGTQAIKIGRIRPLRFSGRLLLMAFSRARREHFLSKYGPGFWSATKHDVLAGFYANRLEFDYFSKTQDPRVMPTLAQFLGGWIIVQLRGRPIFEDELNEVPALRSCCEGSQAQFCRHPSGQVVLIDYGRQDTLESLPTV